MSEEVQLTGQCLSFSQIPHTTRLFADYLAGLPKVAPFYSRPPQFRSWFQEEAQKVVYDARRRARVTAALERQNRAWGASAKTLANLEKLRSGSLAAVSGQQVGLFGGCLLALLKVLTAVKLAEEATAGGVPTVPVFWLATEDHDVAEVSQAGFLGSDHLLRRLTAATEGLPGAPVAAVKFGAEITGLVEEAAALLGGGEVADLLRETYQPGETLASAFARLYARLFADFGVIFLDPADSELHAVAEPLLRSAIEQALELNEALLTRGKALTAAGYHEQVKVTSSSTLLFDLRGGARVPIHRLNRTAEMFEIGGEKVAREDLLRHISESPMEFSPNALFRPVVQDYLLPTLVYSGGPAETAYLAQTGAVSEKVLRRVTPLFPRFSATLVEAKTASLLTRYGLSVLDTFGGEESLREKLAAKTLPADLQQGFDGTRAAVERAVGGIRTSLTKLDPTLVDAAERAGRKMLYQVERLKARAARAELQRTEVLERHAAILSAALFPHKALAEREIAGVHYLARNGRQLLQTIYENIHLDCVDHQVLWV
jgi:bacillithiol biosynthesis cysteine-adding enzyme BshC